MTLIATVFTPTCLVMGADTLIQLTPDHLSTEIIGVEEIQKLFYLSKTNTGISVRGRASWEGRSIKAILHEFSITIDSSFTQKDIAEHFNNYIRKTYPRLNTSFHLSGYTNNEPYVYDMDFDDGFQRENIEKGSLRYSVLARVDDPEVHNKILPLPDFSTMDIAYSIYFLDNLFKYKIEVENKKPIPSVGYPVDYLILTPHGITKQSKRALADFAL
ncbi:hypothetical protein [Peribacillus frigoritolerans]|uniref:hypothetical protein n=1 Tax=Peribacillus frigoritolerans TaxID=450367 RepID=UPI0038214573